MYIVMESLPGGACAPVSPSPPPAESASGNQIPESAFNMAVNYLFYWLEHIKSQKINNLS